MNKPPTPLGQLLTVVSWEGSSVRQYRRGGRGMENVLTTDVFSALDVLPRSPFLVCVLEAVRAASDGALEKLAMQAEDCVIELFPSAHPMRPTAKTHQRRLEVQPDATIISPDVYALIEAKRIKSSSFQVEQLARNLLVLLRDSLEQTPVLLLVLGQEPPISVRGHGRVTVLEGIEIGLESAFRKIEGLSMSIDDVRKRIDGVEAWTTWSAISKAVESALQQYTNPCSSTCAAIQRNARQITEAVAWHGRA